MSIINRVLKDLDRNRALSGTPSGVRAVATERRASLWIWIVLAALLLGSAAGFALRQYRIQRVAVVPPPAPPPQAAPAAPTPPAEVPAEAEAEAVEPEPSVAAGPAPETPAKKAPARAPAKAAVPPAVEALPSTLVPERPRIIKEPSQATPQASANAAFNEARRLIEQGRTREAVDKLAAALNLYPGHMLARQTLVALLADHEPPRAEALIRDGLALHPDEIWFAQAAAQLLVRQGNYAAAAVALKDGLNRGGADGAYWAFLAGVQNKLGRMDEAAQAYRQAVRMQPDNGTWWVGLAVALERQGQKEEARTAYQQAFRTKLGPELKDFVGQKLAELGR